VSIPIVVLGNGRRQCISRSVPSIREHLAGVGDLVIVDDSGDHAYRSWLGSEFDAQVIPVGDGPCGYWQAMRRVWQVFRDTGADACWMHEDDFVLSADVDVTDLATVLDAHPYLTQIALLRGPWFHNEHHHGGLIQALEDQGQTFTEVTWRGFTWLEHRAVFTGNPSLIPLRTFEVEWPDGAWSESRFGRRLFQDPKARGAYWGRRTDPPRVEHIGHERTGSDY
jgi:hypothetical protein